MKLGVRLSVLGFFLRLDIEKKPKTESLTP